MTGPTTTPDDGGQLATYDPAIRWAKTTVRLTYQMWDYRIECDVVVGGNCRGFDVLDWAIETHADQLVKEQGDMPELLLTKPSEDGEGEDTLHCELTDEDDIERSLSKMCVGLRIVKHEKDSKP